MARLIFTRLVDAWESCKDISARSQNDPNYLYAANAVALFYIQWLPVFPRPQSISEGLREEFILSRAALKQTPSTTAASATLESGGAEPSLDNESRESELVGEMFSRVGKAGHIYRRITEWDWGLDGEIEFKDRAGQASGRRVYVQLKSGDSYLVKRARDGEEIFTVKNKRHLEYWTVHQYPVMLVIRQSTGLVRWMNVSEYLRVNGKTSGQIIFRGEEVTVENLQRLALKMLNEE